MKRKLLVLFAHPSLERSEVNSQLLRATHATEHVTVVDLYAEYPTYQIDIDREQRRLLEHDAVIFMFPLYWYSTPSILKEWQDLVLEYGFAYGHEGTALHGKLLLCAITAGGPDKAYCEGGYNHYTLRELLRPLEQTAALCGLHYLAPFALFSSRTAVEENRVHHHLADWQRTLSALRDGHLDIQRAQELPRLNPHLDELINVVPATNTAPAIEQIP
jgi:glutathione-regulated potassium-efflux system ancillary protein KefG